MSGHGGNHVMMLPSGVSVVRFMDAGDYEVSHATRAAEMYRSSCGENVDPEELLFRAGYRVPESGRGLVDLLNGVSPRSLMG